MHTLGMCLGSGVFDRGEEFEPHFSFVLAEFTRGFFRFMGVGSILRKEFRFYRQMALSKRLQSSF